MAALRTAFLEMARSPFAALSLLYGRAAASRDRGPSAGSARGLGRFGQCLATSRWMDEG